MRKLPTMHRRKSLAASLQFEGFQPKADPARNRPRFLFDL
jgi:hypothetical protein